ncbi:MAG: tRNA 2-thiouridine(34) synthase MnmA [Bacteroidales bacterium]|nr:tRNA 2-thiouridine(34) synthase MnmA [Bacteroidales bacterium]
MNIALLLSGGVDSAVATHLLMERGLKPDLFYIKIGMDGDDELTCTAEEDLELCQAIARRYGLPLQVVDLQKEYWERVVSYTMDHVRRGLTPNPDVMCNRLIKFGAFEEKVGHAYDRICTGHYARLIRDEEHFSDPLSGESLDLSSHPVWLGTAPDPVKDQTDFLAQLDRKQVNKIMLPLGHLKKEEVRRIATEHRLAPAKRKDSQGICFLGKINYSDFVRRFLGEREGDVIEFESGKKVGTHRGYWFHTIGQRKGLGLGGGPWFVVKKDLEQNILYVSHGYDNLLQYGRSFRLADFHFITGDPWPKEGEIPITFKVRHTDRWREGTLTRTAAGDFRIDGRDPIQGIAPGQFGVVYSPDGRVCIGSGEIAI